MVTLSINSEGVFEKLILDRFRKIVTRNIKKGYNMNILRHTARRFVNLIMVDNFLVFFSLTNGESVLRQMTTPFLISSDGWCLTISVCIRAHRGPISQ